MPLIRKALKYGIPIGITYLSVQQKLWSQLNQQEINTKLSVIRKYEQQIHTNINQWFGLNVNIPQLPVLSDVKCLWNNGVKKTFNAFNEFDIKSVTKKVEKLLETK